MSSFVLKLIAVFAMTVDHIGAVFFPSELWLRAIGRFTMPIMAYFAAVGYRKTRNITRYLVLLAAFALVSEIPFFLLFGAHSNVLFTIFLGVFALFMGNFAARKTKSPAFCLAVYALCLFVAIAFNTDWSYTGVLLILVFYYANGDTLKTLVYPIPVYVLDMLQYIGKGESYFKLNLIHFWGLLALPLLCFYNGKRGIPAKYFFYIYYPAHILLLWVIKTYLL